MVQLWDGWVLSTEQSVHGSLNSPPKPPRHCDDLQGCGRRVPPQAPQPHGPITSGSPKSKIDNIEPSFLYHHICSIPYIYLYDHRFTQPNQSRPQHSPIPLHHPRTQTISYTAVYSPSR